MRTRESGLVMRTSKCLIRPATSGNRCDQVPFGGGTGARAAPVPVPSSGTSASTGQKRACMNHPPDRARYRLKFYPPQTLRQREKAADAADWVFRREGTQKNRTISNRPRNERAS